MNKRRADIFRFVPEEYDETWRIIDTLTGLIVATGFTEAAAFKHAISLNSHISMLRNSPQIGQGANDCMVRRSLS